MLFIVKATTFYFLFITISALKRNLHANSIKIAVAVMLPGDLLQQPVTPVKNAANTAKNAMINNAIIDLPISEKQTILL